jgi:hypothetical protein
MNAAFPLSMSLGLPERPLIPAFSPVGEKVAAGRMRGFRGSTRETFVRTILTLDEGEGCFMRRKKPENNVILLAREFMFSF